MDFLETLLNIIRESASLNSEQLLGLLLLVVITLGLLAFIYDRKKQSRQEDNSAEFLDAFRKMAARQEQADDERIAELLKTVKDQGEVIKKLEEQIDIFKTERDAANQRVNNLEKELTKQAGQLELVSKDRKRLEDTNKQLERHLQEQTEIASKSLITLEGFSKALARAEQKNEELQARNEKLLARNEELCREIEEHKREIERLKADFDKQIAELTEERDELINKVKAITGQMTRLRNRVTELEKEKAKANEAQEGDEAT